MGAKKVLAVVPYLCYARADRRKLEGEVLSHQISLSLMSSAGIDELITVRVHNPEAYFASVPALTKHNINPFEYFGASLEDNGMLSDNLFIVGPDQGAEDDVKLLASSLNVAYGCLDKQRDAHTHKIVMQDTGFDCKDKDVILIDDVVTSGGTATLAGETILQKSPRSLAFLCVHALSKPEDIVKMQKNVFSTVISSNTVPRGDIRQIDVAPIIARYIKEKVV